jgi:hypothetical protein
MNFKKYVLKETFTAEDLNKAEDILKQHGNDRIYMTAKDAPPQSGIVKQVNDVKYPPKPKGLWYATGDAWLKFVKYDYTQKISEYNKILKLNLDLSRMLIIDTEEKFLAFEKEYVWDDPQYRVGGESMVQYVNWGDVGEKYAGIEISPYFPEFRMNRWYYPWDVASGCVWDFSIIKFFEKIFPQETPVEPKPPEPLSDSERSETTSNGKL